MSGNENNYENSFINSLDFSFKKKKENILTDEDRLQKMLNSMRVLEVFDRPEIEDFSDLYPKEEIKKDIQEVERLEKIFEEGTTNENKNAKIISELFEGIIISESEKSEWLGGNSIVHSASRYDDIKNGVDAVCEFIQENDEDNKFLALGIDVSFGTYTKTEIDKKIKRIEDDIKSNKISKIKYFADQSGKHQSLELPKVVAGADSKTVQELLELWDKKDKKGLAKHPYQCALLITLRQQAVYFYYIAQEAGNNQIAEKYKDAVNTLNEIIEPRLEFLESLYSEAFKDDVASKILEKTKIE